MMALSLWPDIEPAPAPVRRVRRRPGRAQIHAALALADALQSALEPALVGAELGIDGPGDIERSGRVVRLALGPRRFLIVVRCVE